MTAKRFTIHLIIVCFLPAVLAGCFGRSPSPRFYTLTPPESGGTPEPAGLESVVAVGPVAIPDYLDRQQIVTRSGRNEIALAEFDRWGGPLEEEISRALVAALAARLSPARIAVFPWRSVYLASARTVYRIPVTVVRFDGTLGEKVVLTAVWGVFVRGEKREAGLLSKESTVTEEVGDKGYGALVAAMERAVERLGKEMADSVAAVDVKKGAP